MRHLNLAGAFSDRTTAADVAAQTHGILLSATAPETSHLPFAALVLAATDDLQSFQSQSDIGAFLVCERTIKNAALDDLTTGNAPGCVGVFTMVANPGLGERKSDQHWRDNHAPLALKVHTAMTHYYQLSILHRFKGPDWNGFALCCFDNEDDLRHRFFDTPEGEAAIGKDVALFADTRKSPRRVIAEFSTNQNDRSK